jgi:hypothetical protein
MKILALAGVTAFLFLGVACTAQQRCEFYEGVHANKIKEANGDAKKIAIANIVYAPLKAGCAAQGVDIN